MGQVLACKKHGRCTSEKVKELAQRMDLKDVEDFAKTKHRGLPEVKKKVKCFEEWLKERDPELYEVATSTCDVAAYPQKTIPMVTRGNLGWSDVVEDDKKKKTVKFKKVVIDA